MHSRTSRWRTGISVLGIMAVVGAVGIGASASVAGAGGSAKAIKPYKNSLSGNTKGWCTVADGCSGAYNASGTIDVVKASFSNFGGYGYGAPAPTGQKKFARISGAPGLGFADTPVTPATQLNLNGCSRPGGEFCDGPYVIFGGGTDKTFPVAGFTSSIKLYIDDAWAEANQGQVIDSDVSLNDNTGNYLVDNVFNLCATATGWAVSDSQNAGGCNAGDVTLTTSGWYTFSETFSQLNGVVYVTYNVLDSSGNSVWSTDHSVTNPGTGLPQAAATTGGPNYYWLPDEDALGLPVADISLIQN